MPDLLSEDVITLRQAAALLPRRRGRPANYSTVWRWATAGSRGVVLQTAALPGGRVTSRQALSRFVAELTARADADRLAPRVPSPSTTRGRNVERAQHVVDKLLG
jgi:hypothetical protein